jgi:hypothetical protein
LLEYKIFFIVKLNRFTLNSTSHARAAGLNFAAKQLCSHYFHPFRKQEGPDALIAIMPHFFDHSGPGRVTFVGSYRFSYLRTTQPDIYERGDESVRYFRPHSLLGWLSRMRERMF